jgi:hypothetical protein
LLRFSPKFSDFVLAAIGFTYSVIISNTKKHIIFSKIELGLKSFFVRVRVVSVLCVIQIVSQLMYSAKLELD